MKIYFAGESSLITDVLYKPENPLQYNILKTYADGEKTIKKAMKPLIDLFLDSGAFSAWSKDRYIDLNAYIDFIKKFVYNVCYYS